LAGASFGQCCRIRSVIKLSADAPHAIGLLRARRQRPRSCRAADQRDEIASFQARAAGREGLLITSRL
jgi:hypothetical protein